ESAQSVCPKYIAPPDGASHRKFATGSRAKTFQATTRCSRKVFGRRFRPAAKRAGPERKSKTATISADARNDSKLRRPTGDDREWNRVFRHRSGDRQEKPGRFATARACAR